MRVCLSVWSVYHSFIFFSQANHGFVWSNPSDREGAETASLVGGGEANEQITIGVSNIWFLKSLKRTSVVAKP